MASFSRCVEPLEHFLGCERISSSYFSNFFLIEIIDYEMFETVRSNGRWSINWIIVTSAFAVILHTPGGISLDNLDPKKDFNFEGD